MRKGATAPIIGMVLFIALFFSGFWYVDNVASGADLSFETELNNTTTIEVNENWLSSNVSKDNGTYFEVNSDDEMYIEAGENDTWISKDYNFSNVEFGSPYRFAFYGDPRDGTIDITLRSFNSSDDIIDTKNIEINDSFQEVTYGYEERATEYVDVKIEMNETSGSNNERPNIAQYEFEVFLADYPQDVGLNNDRFYIMTIFVFLMIGILYVAKLFAEQ